MNSRFFIKIRKSLIIAGFVAIFFGTLIINIPAWVLNYPLTKYSHDQLKFYNLSGSFWSGSGLLVASSQNKRKLIQVPLIHLSWNISFGISRYANIKLFLDKHPVANVYFDSHGLNIDNLNLTLAISQVSSLSDVASDLKLSGGLQVTAKHIIIGNKQMGTITAIADNLSSGMSPVNPLGDYIVTLNIENNAITVDTKDKNSNIMLNGSGTFKALTIKASINASKVEQMKTFITFMGEANADGTYNLKLF